MEHKHVPTNSKRQQHKTEFFLSNFCIVTQMATLKLIHRCILHELENVHSNKHKNSSSRVIQ